MRLGTTLSVMFGHARSPSFILIQKGLLNSVMTIDSQK